MERTGGKPDLELMEDPRFEAREWKVQRVAWAIIATLIILGLLGLFGAGPLSSHTVKSADGALTLYYDRFERFESPSSLRVELRPSGEPTARLWINAEFLNGVKVESIVPPPARVELRDAGTVYAFTVPRDTVARIALYVQTQKKGKRAIRMRANDGPLLEAAAWVYP